jgi:hypothetical protein
LRTKKPSLDESLFDDNEEKPEPTRVAAAAPTPTVAPLVEPKVTTSEIIVNKALPAVVEPKTVKVNEKSSPPSLFDDVDSLFTKTAPKKDTKNVTKSNSY